jgi:hypothetical protein
MARAMISTVAARVSSFARRFHRPNLRLQAQRLWDEHGEAAIPLLRQQIAGCPHFEERQRLYRLHDVIARQREA